MQISEKILRNDFSKLFHVLIFINTNFYDIKPFLESDHQ